MPEQLTGSGVYPLAAELLPPDEIVESRYEARFARDFAELDAILKLRFEVFNLELGEGLESSLETRRDRDEFDAFCHHLLVTERSSGEIVGTYRIQTSDMAAAGLGFYTSTLFDLSALPEEVVDDAVEVGRACIALTHRNTAVLFLLWKGLARYMVHSQRRFLFGCCSLTSQDPELGKTVMRFLELRGHLHPELRISPRPGYECYAPDDQDLPEPDPRLKLPKLFRTYLRHGAKVCGPPAIDREFKTIDYLVIFDVAAMQDRQFRTFFG